MGTRLSTRLLTLGFGPYQRVPVAPQPTTPVRCGPMPTGDALHAHFDVTAVRATLLAYRDTVRRHEALLNRWNVYPEPDGDTGSNMAYTLSATVDAMEAAPKDLVATCAAIAHGSLMGARGSSGVILSQLLRGFVGSVANAAGVGGASAHDLGDALQAAFNAAYGAVPHPQEGTMLSVAREAAKAASLAVETGTFITPVELLRTARLAAREALVRTPQQLHTLAEAGVVDAGAAGFVLLFDAALFVLDGEPIQDLNDLTDVVVPPKPDRFRYEVTFMLDVADTAVNRFRHAWALWGDCMVVAGGDGLWSCHIHTNDIGAVMETALDIGGRPHHIRVTDLFDDMNRCDAFDTVEPERIPTCAVVALAQGNGVSALLTGLGTAFVVTGGQTISPSTSELIEAVELVVACTGAAQVVLMPNSISMIASALQVDAFVAATVSVVPTRNVVEALSALEAFDPHKHALDNVKSMSAAMSAVRTGEITCSASDTTSPAGAVRSGDWLGSASGQGIVTISPTLTTAVLALVEHMVGNDAKRLMVLAGDGAIGGVDNALRTWVSLNRPALTLDWHRGDQPLSPYVFGVT